MGGMDFLILSLPRVVYDERAAKTGTVTRIVVEEGVRRVRAYCALFFLFFFWSVSSLWKVCEMFFIHNINESLFSIKNDVFMTMML